MGHIDDIPLWNTDIIGKPLGVGTYQWGDRMMWGYTKTHTAKDAREAFRVGWESEIRLLIRQKWVRLIGSVMR